MCYAILIKLTTQADIFRLGNSTRFIIGLFLFRSIGIESLPCLFRPISSVREGHIAGGFDSSAYTRCRQTVCNLNNARQICILVACIEQLISQLVQYFLDMILFCCRITIRKATGNPLAIGNQSDPGIGSGSLDRKITAIDGQRIIGIMLVNNRSITAIVVDGDSFVGILINQAAIAVQFGNITTCKRRFQCICRHTGLVRPAGTFCHSHIDLSRWSVVCATWYIAGSPCPLGALGQIDVDQRSRIIGDFHIPSHIQHACRDPITGIEIDGALIGKQSIIIAVCGSIRHIHSFDDPAGRGKGSTCHRTDSISSHILDIHISVNRHIRTAIEINACCIGSYFIRVLYTFNRKILIECNLSTAIHINTICPRRTVRLNPIYLYIGIRNQTAFT